MIPITIAEQEADFGWDVFQSKLQSTIEAWVDPENDGADVGSNTMWFIFKQQFFDSHSHMENSVTKITYVDDLQQIRDYALQLLELVGEATANLSQGFSAS